MYVQLHLHTEQSNKFHVAENYLPKFLINLDKITICELVPQLADCTLLATIHCAFSNTLPATNMTSTVSGITTPYML